MWAVRFIGNVYHIIWKVGMACTKMKNSPEALLEEFSKNNRVMKIFLCIVCHLEQLFKCTSIVTLGNAFQKFQAISEL